MLIDTHLAGTERLSSEPISQRIAIARGWVNRLSSEAKLVEESLASWRRYLDLLEGVHRAEQELEVAAVNGRVHVSAEATRRCSLTQLVVHFAFQQPEHRTTNKAAVAWTIGQGLYGNRQRAKVAVNGILAHRRDLFRRFDRGAYALTVKAIQMGRRLSLEMRSEVPFWPLEGLLSLADQSNGRHIRQSGVGSP